LHHFIKYFYSFLFLFSFFFLSFSFQPQTFFIWLNRFFLWLSFVWMKKERQVAVSTKVWRLRQKISVFTFLLKHIQCIWNPQVVLFSDEKLFNCSNLTICMLCVYVTFWYNLHHFKTMYYVYATYTFTMQYYVKYLKTILRIYNVLEGWQELKDSIFFFHFIGFNYRNLTFTLESFFRNIIKIKTFSYISTYFNK
jgi:hypothetical protein